MIAPTLTVARSENAKLGRIAATYRTQDSCPRSCPLYGQGCYARGRIFGTSARLGRSDPGAIGALRDTIPAGGMLRLNVSGDFLAGDGTLDTDYVGAIGELAAARPDVRVFGYTHAWRELSAGFLPGAAVNASCETRADVIRATADGWQVAVVDPGPGEPGSLIGDMIAGRRVVQCPAQTHGVTCETCGLCARTGDRRPIVAFAAHGGGARQARAAVASRRDAAE